MAEHRRYSRAVSFSRSVYEKLLVAYPERFRRLYGEEMLDLFEDECREQIERGGVKHLPRVWMRMLADLVSNAVLERGRFEVGSSVVRWGGFLAVVGGVILATSGILMSWILHVLTEWGSQVPVVQMAGMLGMVLIAGGPIALIALIAGRADFEGRRLGGLRPSGSRRLTWTQRSAVTGFLFSILAVLATIGLFVTTLTYEMFPQSPNVIIIPGALQGMLFSAFALLSGLGLPAATMFLGVSIWRSGILGRWRSLPTAVGALTILAPFVSLLVVQLIPGYAFSTTTISMFLIVGSPPTVVGLAWVLLGLVLIRRESVGQDAQLITGTS